MGTIVATSLHTVAAVLWVGGIFLAYRVLRPAAMALEPPQRLTLWADVFGRFFPMGVGVYRSVGDFRLLGLDDALR